MSVYWIGHAKMRDSEGYREYGARVKEAAERYPYETLVRGGAYKVLEGENHFDRHVILRFKDMDAALRYYNSPEYQVAAAIRQSASDGTSLVLVEGLMPAS